MSNFWATTLGTQAPTQAQPRTNPGGYSPSPYFAPPQTVQAPSQAPEEPEGPPGPEQWGNVAEASRKALSARLTDTCPDCGSANFFSPHGMPNAMPQCYECGYNPRFAQMTAGGGLPSDSNAPSRPARQLNPKGTSNYNPQQIVDRVGK